MKNFFSKSMMFLGALSLILGAFTAFGSNPSYADDLEVIGNELGLEVTSENTRLFDLTNLNPGDTHEAKIDIKNNYTDPFEVFMKTERTSHQPEPGEADLFEQLELTIYLDNVQIYTGPMKDYAKSNISLGDLNQNAEKELRAVVHLPGPETGNEFQGKSVEVKWIFIAQADPDEPPGGGGGGSTVIITPIEPEEPEEEIKEEVPEDIPDEPEDSEVEIQEIDEEIPEDKPEKPGELEEEIEEEIPEAQPIMPKTGEIPATIYYALGSMLVGLGLGFRKKDKK
jgi:LPXTG-motif cell wall-anchored protein